MADTVTKKQRSKNMALIRSRGNRSTEMALISLLRKNKINGWRRYNNLIVGRPDFVFSKKKLAVFVDGCFWHGCVRCNLSPKSNRPYWNKKIANNKNRDISVKKDLTKNGWKVVRIWEHEIKNKSGKVLLKIQSILNTKKDPIRVLFVCSRKLLSEHASWSPDWWRYTS
jgi:DNA mismatch endonuclease (patch repair protein)